MLINLEKYVKFTINWQNIVEPIFPLHISCRDAPILDILITTPHYQTTIMEEIKCQDH